MRLRLPRLLPAIVLVGCTSDPEQHPERVTNLGEVNVTARPLAIGVGSPGRGMLVATRAEVLRLAPDAPAPTTVAARMAVCPSSLVRGPRSYVTFWRDHAYVTDGSACGLWSVSLLDGRVGHLVH